MKLLTYLLKIMVVVGLCMPAPMLVAMQQKAPVVIQQINHAIDAGNYDKAADIVRKVFAVSVDPATVDSGIIHNILETQEQVREFVNKIGDLNQRARLQKIIDPKLAAGIQASLTRPHVRIVNNDEELKLALAVSAREEAERKHRAAVQPVRVPVVQPVRVVDQIFPGQGQRLGEIPAAPAPVVQPVAPLAVAQPVLAQPLLAQGLQGQAVNNSVAGWFKSNWRLMTAVAAVATLGAWWFFKN